MRIFIAGAGEVGTHLAKMLCNAKHDVILMDEDEEKLKQIDSHFDLMTIVGTISSIEDLKEANVKSCDLFIAVPPYQDMSILSCILAKKLGATTTVARVNNHEYLLPENKEFFRQLGIDELIYPEQLGASETVASLKQVGTRQMVEFSGSKLVLFAIKVRDNALIVDKTMAEISAMYETQQYNIVAINRHGETIIPRGSEVVLHNDLIYVLTTKSAVDQVLLDAGKTQFEIKNVMILGGSRIGMTSYNVCYTKLLRLAVMLPETDSSPDSEALARQLTDKFKVKAIVENISGALDGFGCYSRRDEAVKRVIPEYNPAIDKMKVIIPKEFVGKNLPPVHYVAVVFADGTEKQARLPLNEYLQIVASSNFKQRSRASMLYYHAEALHYAVIGTPNKHEVQQGFFVKYGDGAADVMPIGNLFKTQVYQIARYLGVPDEIIKRPPTTDTYTAEQTQEEFFYQMPFEEMDLFWYGWEQGYSPDEVGSVMGKSADEVLKIYRNFERKKKTTDYLRTPPVHNYLN